MKSRTKIKKKFTPFIHENLEIKNELLEMARKARTQAGENALELQLSSVLIYTTIAEYLAENLIDTLTHLVRESTYKDFAGILVIESIKSRENGKMNLGEAKVQIDKFTFPDKANILDCISLINVSRNKIFHRFAKSDIDEITKLVKEDLPTIQDKCEELIIRVNTIYAGLQKIISPALITESSEK